jgi:hypothetical protein
METGVSNFFFKECKAPLADGVTRFLIKSRADIQFTPKLKNDILHTDNGLCNCGKIGFMKHLISCCSHRASLMTKRHNNVGRIIVQAIEANKRKKLVKCMNGQCMRWNQELKLSDDILNSRKFIDVFNRSESKRRPDIWYNSKERRGENTELKLNLIEVTIPWNDAVINPGKFEKGGSKKYKLAPFTLKEISESTLANARTKKEDKYKPIIDEANQWLQKIIEVSRIKYKVSSVNVRSKFVIISKLGIVPRATKKDVCDIVSIDKKREVTL